VEKALADTPLKSWSASLKAIVPGKLETGRCDFDRQIENQGQVGQGPFCRRLTKRP
jgi:hypothetical protein